MSDQVRLLCVDDEPGVVELISLIFQPQNVQVEGATNGLEALETMRRNPPDVVMLDIMMPDMDGWDVYHQMRADETLKNIPVIIVTARNNSFEEIIARERAGVSDYVTKPFVPNDLRQSLAKVFDIGLRD